MSRNNLALTAFDADTLVGESGGASLQGNPFDDLLPRHAEDDTLLGGDGRDVLRTGDGRDWLYGGAGDDVFFAEAGQNYLIGGDGAETYPITGASNFEPKGPERDQVHVGKGGLSLDDGPEADSDVITFTDPAILDPYAVTDSVGRIWIGGGQQEPAFRASGSFGSGSDGALLFEAGHVAWAQDHAGVRYELSDLLAASGGTENHAITDFHDQDSGVQFALSDRSVGQQTPLEVAAVLGSGWNDTLIGNSDPNLLHGEAGDDLILADRSITVEELSAILDPVEHLWLLEHLEIPIQEEPDHPDDVVYDPDPIMFDEGGLGIYIA